MLTKLAGFRGGFFLGQGQGGLKPQPSAPLFDYLYDTFKEYKDVYICLYICIWVFDFLATISAKNPIKNGKRRNS